MAENISTLDRTSALSRLLFRVLLPVSAVLVLGLAIAYTSDVPLTDLLNDPSAPLVLYEAIKNGIGIPSPVTIAFYGVIGIVLFWRAWPYLKT